MGSVTPVTNIALNTQSPPIAEALSQVFALTDLKPSTRKTYEYATKHFTSWAQDRPLDPTILIAYKNYLRDNPKLSAKTRSLYLAAARTIFRQLFSVGVLSFDASKLVRSFEVERAHKKPPITDAQVRRAFTYAHQRNDTRLVLVLNLLYRQGLRQKEVVDIRVEHFNEETMTLSILGKGRDDRETIHLHPETVRSIREHLDAQGSKAGYVFPSREKKTHIRTVTVYRLVKQIHNACRISNSPHSWRKAFTSRLIESGMNLLDVQSYTRHRSVAQLQVYFDRISFAKSLPAFYAAFSGSDPVL